MSLSITTVLFVHECNSLGEINILRHSTIEFFVYEEY